jgi:RNA polymerase sigma factor (sigma-70 family)
MPTLEQRFLADLNPHKAMLYQVAHAYCSRREDRSDLIQDMIVELWRAYPRFDGRAAFSTFLHRIAVNVAISHYRGQNRRIRDALPIDELGIDLVAADRVLDAEGAELHALHQLIAQLDEVNRAVVLLYLQGYSAEEIAEMVGLGASNIGTRINRIKQQLQRLCAAEDKS